MIFALSLSTLSDGGRQSSDDPTGIESNANPSPPAAPAQDGALRAYGPGDSYVQDVATDANGDIFLRGVGLGKYSGQTYDELWFRTFPTDSPGDFVDAQALAIDSVGNVVIVDECHIQPPSIDYGGGHIDCAGDGSIVAKYTGDGDHLFSYGYFGIQMEDVAIAADDRIVIIGTYHYPTLDLGGGVLPKSGPGLDDDEEIFVLELQP